MLPLLLDAFAAGASVERAIAQVQNMGRPTASDGEPPQVFLAAQGSAIPYHGLTWVISQIDWGDALMNDQGDRVRQFFTLTLVEYVEDVYLTERSAANRRRRKAASRKRKPGAKSKRVVAKRASRRRVKRGRAAVVDDFGAGESLATIAARELGDASRWPEIAELNGLRDPRAIAPGQVIRLP